MPSEVEIWGQIIAQLGFGGLALWMLWKFGNKFTTNSAKQIEAMMTSRDLDTVKAREERMETSDRLTSVLSVQRAELMACIDRQRESFREALVERDQRTRELAAQCHIAQERSNVALVRLADATVELRTGFAALETAVRSGG